MSQHRTTTVGALTAQDCGQIIALDNGTETIEDVLVEVSHNRKGVTHVETEIHWEGNWPSSTPCTIISKGASQ